MSYICTELRDCCLSFFQNDVWTIVALTLGTCMSKALGEIWGLC